MNLEQARKLYKDALSKKFTVEECVNIMAPMNIPIEIIASIAELVCDQPERLSDLESEKTMRQSEPSNERDGDYRNDNPPEMVSRGCIW